MIKEGVPPKIWERFFLHTENMHFRTIISQVVIATCYLWYAYNIIYYCDIISHYEYEREKKKLLIVTSVMNF